MDRASSSTQVPVTFHPKVMEETRPVLLFEKVLEVGDVSPGVCALFVRSSSTLMAALTPLESNHVCNQVGIAQSYLQIVATDHLGVEHVLRLEKWGIGETMLLSGEWLRFVKVYRLQQGDTIQGWGYRSAARAGELRLALNFIKTPR